MCVSARRRSLRYNELSLSLSALLLRVCLCGPKSCFFTPPSLPLFVLLTSLITVDNKLCHTDLKKIKKRYVSLSFRSALFQEKRFLKSERDAFFLSQKRRRKKKRKKNPKPSRGRVYQRARRKREKKKSDRFSNESNFFLPRGAFCVCFSRSRRRRGRNARERERGQRFVYLTLLTLY